jgi:hypothetical protein
LCVDVKGCLRETHELQYDTEINNDMYVTLILGYGAAKELVAKWVLRSTPWSKSGVCEGYCGRSVFGSSEV